MDWDVVDLKAHLIIRKATEYDRIVAELTKMCDDSDETGGGLKGWILADRVRNALEGEV